MKKYILFGLTLLMAFPVSIAAQNEDATEDEDVISVLARKLQPKHKQYPTRVMSSVPPQDSPLRVPSSALMTLKDTVR